MTPEEYRAAGKELVRDLVDTALRHPHQAEAIDVFTNLSFETLPADGLDRERVMQQAILEGAVLVWNSLLMATTIQEARQGEDFDNEAAHQKAMLIFWESLKRLADAPRDPT
jgi:hypothetical protein